MAGYVDPEAPRPRRITSRVLAMSDAEVGAVLGALVQTLASRLRDPATFLLNRFAELNGTAFAPCSVSDERQQLIAAYFCAEYSFEAAALFNPSMVRHLKQPILPDGRAQFAELARPLVTKVAPGVYRDLLIDRLSEAIKLPAARLNQLWFNEATDSAGTHAAAAGNRRHAVRHAGTLTARRLIRHGLRRRVVLGRDRHARGRPGPRPRGRER